MRFFIILFAIVFFRSPGQAQDSWKVFLNGKTILKSNTEDAQKNQVKISTTDLKKKKELDVKFNSASEQKGWERTISIYDEKDRELFKQKGHELKIKDDKLLEFFKSTKSISIYTMSIPTDPKMKASVRVRRVHLCTLVNKERETE